MDSHTVEQLSLKYPNWKITPNPNLNVDLEITSKLEDNVDEMLSLLKDLNAIIKEDNTAIEIEKFNTLQIRIKKGSKGSKYRKMYTSGSFDIFHSGHLNILKKSKELCDYLIVGVSTDELIEKEKGKRPVIPFQERMNVVKAISYVDEVIPQVDKNKQRIVDEYNIDAISVGDDWKGRYPKTSCPVEYFAYTANISSTILKDTLQLQNKS
jgi:glycerol-3-phosphate cytidylyltransferase